MRNHRRVLLTVTVLFTIQLLGLAAEAKKGPAVPYPAFGVSFEPPPGWVEQMKDKPQTIGTWTHPRGTAEDPKVLITVEGAKPAIDSAQKTAEGLAQNFSGTVLKETTTLDGEKAWRVRSEQQGAALHPVEAVVAMHDGYVYMIMGGVTGANSCGAQVERLRGSWKWIKLEPPSKHLVFRKQPLTALGGNIVINVPQEMRRNSNDNPDHVLDLSIPNLRRSEPDFLLYAQLVPRNPQQSFDELKKGFIAGLGQKLKLDPPPKWRTRPQAKNAPASAITPVLDVDGATIGQQGRAYIVFALVELDPKQAVLVNFTLSAETEPERKAYVAAIDQIIDSIRPATKPAGPARGK